MIGDTQEVQLTVGGRTVPIWIVRVGDRLYIRSYLGASGRWYRHVLESRRARIDDIDVTLVPAPDDVNDAVDAAFHDKYGHSIHAEAMVAPEVRTTTLEVVL